MKAALLKVLPSPIRPFARHVYRRILGKPGLMSASQYRSLTALKCRVSYNRYGGYCVPESSRHRPASVAILSRDVWEPDTIEFMRRACADGDIVHAGTFFGDFLPGISSAIAPSAKIWAFEPSAENYRCAKITIEINALRNVVLTHAGLGSERKSAKIKTTNREGVALGGGSIIAEDGREPVEIMTVDEAVDRRTVSVIQLDVEGYEKEALAGALGTIERCHPFLILEDVPGYSVLGGTWFAENILAQGYRQVARLHDNAVFSF